MSHIARTRNYEVGQFSIEAGWRDPTIVLGRVTAKLDSFPSKLNGEMHRAREVSQSN